jgi:hypothetical protein
MKNKELFNSLQIEEQQILKILSNESAAMSLKQIRKKMAIKIAEKSKSGSIFLKGLKKLNDRETEKLISFLNKNTSEKVSAYYKFKSILKTLETKKLVMKRELEGQKAKEIWFLSKKGQSTLK